MTTADPSLPLDVPPAREKLGLAPMAWYALPGGAVTFLYTLTVVMYLNYTVDVLLVNASAVGLLMLIAKVWDAVSDPIAGYLSDRTKSRFGRRKSWLLGCSIPLALFSVMMWVPPASLGADATLVWLAVGMFGFYTAYTGFEVPHLALGAELTFGATERNRLFGVRTVVKTTGMLLCFVLGVGILESENARAYSGPLFVGAGAITMISIWLLLWKVPSERSDYAGKGAQNPFRAIRDVWNNRLARNVLIVYFIEMCGTGGIGVLTPFVVKYVLQMPGMIAPFLGVYALSQFIGIPIWIKAGDRFEKQNVWMFAMGQSLVGFGLVLFLTEGNWPLMVLTGFLAGSAGACSNTIGTSLKADVIDTDEYETGERKEGSFFAAWSFSNKLAGGLMVGVTGVALDLIGYVPNQEQTEAAKQGMLFLMGGVPVIAYGIGMLLFRNFDLKRADHERMRREIDARRDADYSRGMP